MIYKVVGNLAHIPLPNTVQLSYSRTRANHPYKLMHIAANSNAYTSKHSFFPRVTFHWTSLPSEAVCAESSGHHVILSQKAHSNNLVASKMRQVLLFGCRKKDVKEIIIATGLKQQLHRWFILIPVRTTALLQ